ncbi:MAG: LOG family protein [bacterium]|nr:LOG family protein [bacterium]
MAIKITNQAKKKSFPSAKVERVAFFGFADSTRNDAEYKLAFETAKLVAEAGYTVVDGGGPGVMEAASRGAKAGNGRTIGVTFYPQNAVNFEGKATTNILDEEIITKNYLERTLRLLEYGQVYMIFNGGTGTISEFAMAWGMARLYFGHHKPLILCGKQWYEIIAAFTRNMKIRDEELNVFSIVDSPAEALSELKAFDLDLAGTRLDWDRDIDENEKPFVL